MKLKPPIKLVEPAEAPPEGQPAGGGDGGGGPAKPAEKTFTQAELTAVATREKNEGKAAAERAIAETLGVPVDEAAAIIKAAREAEDKTKSEAQRDREAAAKEKEQAEADRAAARAEAHQARLERAFAKEGFDFGEGDEAQAKARRVAGLLTVEPGASYDDVLADVQKVKADFPGLFGEPKEPERRLPGGDPKGKPPKPAGGEDAFARGAERAKARYQPGYDPLKK